MNFLRLLFFVIGVSVAFVATFAGATTVRFAFSVPLQCNVETVYGAATETGVAFVVNERCNNDRGYALYLDDASDTVLAVRYNGQTVEAIRGGRTLLARSRRARDRRSRIEIDVKDGVRVTEAVIVIAPAI